AGCGDVDPVSDGLDRPTGGVVVTSNGTALVGDTEKGRVLLLAFMSGGFSNYYLFVEPGNHRVSRHRANNFHASGSIGQGARDFFDDASGEAGLEPGSFTGPTGVVVDDVDRTLFVID